MDSQFTKKNVIPLLVLRKVRKFSSRLQHDNRQRKVKPCSLFREVGRHEIDKDRGLRLVQSQL